MPVNAKHHANPNDTNVLHLYNLSFESLEKIIPSLQTKTKLGKQQTSPSICLIKLTFSKFSRFTMEDAKPIRGKNRIKTLESDFLS